MNEEVLKKVRQIDIQLRSKVQSLFSGRHRSIFRGQGMVFSDFREYVPGDDIRSLSWNLLARTAKPYVKTFEEEKEAHIVLLVDISKSLQFGSGKTSKKEASILLSSLLALCGERNQNAVGLLLFSKDVDFYLPPKKGRKQIFHILKELCSRESHHTVTDINPACSFLSSVLKKRSHIFVLSDFLFSTSWDQALKRLACRHDLVNVSLRDPLEVALPKLGLIDVEDLETGEIQTLSSSSYFFQKEFSKQAKASLSLRDKTCLKARADLISVDTSQDIYEPIIQFFLKRKRAI